MNARSLRKLTYRAQVRLGLTAAEFRGLLLLAGLLAVGVTLREWHLRIPTVDPEVYRRLEAEFQERARWAPEPQMVGPAIPPTPEPTGAAHDTDDSQARIDINRADASQLQTLPRIGPQLAARIIDHRSRMGPFRSPNDLLMVQGIGPATLARLLPLVVARGSDDGVGTED